MAARKRVTPGTRFVREWRGKVHVVTSPKTVATAGRTASGPACRWLRARSPAHSGRGLHSSARSQEARRMTKLRCAIYTRKSSEEGLEQDFNSLDAQHEACAAYIKSQASEGWKLVRERYDDGGISGGTLERPALQRLLADIAAGHIDIVVVYKVDRLTRSLLDFRQTGRSVRQGRHQLRLDHPVVQHHDQHGSADPQHAAVVRPVRARGHRRTHPRQDCAVEGHAACGWVGRRRLAIDPMGAALRSSRKMRRIVRHIFNRYAELGNVRLLAEELEEVRHSLASAQ